MAKKPLTGWRWFEAMGRRDKSKGRPLRAGMLERIKWPAWARQAYACGWIDQVKAK